MDNEEQKRLVNKLRKKDPFTDCDDDIEKQDIIMLNRKNTKTTTYMNIILTILTVTVVLAFGAYILNSFTTENGNNSDIDNSSNLAGSNQGEPGGDILTAAATTTTAAPQQKQQLDLSINPLQITQISKSYAKPVLPGVYHLNKGYNMLTGKAIYELSGQDIIDYTFFNEQGGKRYTQSVSDTVYMIPFEFRSVPNVVPTCDLFAEVSNVEYTTSTSVLEQQANSWSFGADWKFDIEASGKKTVDSAADAAVKSKTETGGKVSTEVRLGFNFGNSKQSRSARFESKSGFKYSFSSTTRNTLYEAEIDWNGYSGNFLWKSQFISDIENLNNDTSNKNILLFFIKWGTHVLSKMETGSFCQETIYASQDSDYSDVESYRNNVWQNSIEIFNFKYESNSESTNVRSGTSSNGVLYQKSDLECHGEVKNTNNYCQGLTSDTNNPIVTKYQLLPIWEIKRLSFNQETINNISIFYDKIYESLSECKNEICDGKGVCGLIEYSLTESFINNEFDGNDFSVLWDKNGYCFCIDEYCQETEALGCECSGGIDCCCNAGNQCDNSNLCKPNEDICIAQHISSTICGSYGEFIECPPNGGIITSTCGSGGEADCGKYSGMCDSGSYSGLRCSYPDLGTINTNNQWYCKSYGQKNECDLETNPLLIGICGSGGNQDCKSKCVGYNGILCGNIDNIKINENECLWVDQWSWGKFIDCPDGYVGTGWCGIGYNKYCDGNTSQLKCCKLSYDEIDDATSDTLQ